MRSRLVIAKRVFSFFFVFLSFKAFISGISFLFRSFFFFSQPFPLPSFCYSLSIHTHTHTHTHTHICIHSSSQFLLAGLAHFLAPILLFFVSSSSSVLLFFLVFFFPFFFLLKPYNDNQRNVIRWMESNILNTIVRHTHRESKFALSHGEASKPFDSVCNPLALLSQDHVFLQTNLSFESV